VIDLPKISQTRSGQRVIAIEHWKGLIRGEVRVGIDQRGEALMQKRYWYPSGQMTEACIGPNDLLLCPDETTGCADDLSPGFAQDWRNALDDDPGEWI
jgi:hypothetical protein